MNTKSTECINNFYIESNDVKKTEEFNDDILSKERLIYEVIRIINGIPLFFEKHYNRLINSSNISKIKIAISEKEIINRINKLISVNQIKNGNVKMIISASGITEFYFVRHYYPSVEQYSNGVKTIFLHEERTNPNAKIWNADFKKRVNMELNKNNAFEAILVDKNGYITEGSKSNIFIVKNNVVYTSPIADVLPGVTRDIIVEICKKLGIQIKEERIKYTLINNYDALFITGTSPKVLPISKINDIEFASSSNAIVIDIMKDYNKIVEEYIYMHNGNSNK